MSFGTDDLRRLAVMEEVEIETQAPDEPAHRTIVWVVVDGADTFVRSYTGESARWFREVNANPAVGLHVDGRRLTATAVPATDPDSIERISAALAAKYAHEPVSLAAMLEPGIVHANFRLEPA